MTDLYPVTIVKTRYGGLYEGGAWGAFYCDPETVPEDAFGSDIECAEVDAGTSRRSRGPRLVRRAQRREKRRKAGRRLYVGVGVSPDAALEALEAVVPAEERSGSKC